MSSATQPDGPTLLAPDEHAPGRPFTAPEATDLDLEVLAVIRAAQRLRIAEGHGGGTWIDDHGVTHWLVAPRPELVLGAAPCLAVGFFGQARSDVDHAPIVALERTMLAAADAIPGLLAYHNVQLADARWGNLVLFQRGTDTSPMRREHIHADAMALAPGHYHSLRLHRGTLTRVVADEEAVELATTLYVDFDVAPPWRAVRSA
jgi:hypothetical protein